MKTPKINQVHPPLPKKKRIDEKGNDHRRLWLRDGKTTMPFVEGLTENACRVLINHINNYLTQIGQKPLPKTKFLITR
jgi:hypothetical protein